jgi:hypothetical protein
MKTMWPRDMDVFISRTRWSENIRMLASNRDGNMYFLQKACPKIPERGTSDDIISIPNLTPSIFTITAQYEYQNKKITEDTVIDLQPYLGSALPHDPMVNQLKKLRETIEKK